MNVEVLQYAMLHVKKPLQGHKGGDIETLLKGQSQIPSVSMRCVPQLPPSVARQAVATAASLLTASPAFCATGVGAPAPVLDTLAEMQRVLQKHHVSR
jgi:hypothetical protein